MVLLVLSCASDAQVKILFDATKAESAGNADWVIDADNYNLGYSGGMPVAGNGSEANPQRIPSPAQSTITASTTEDYWSGALSNWAIDCVKQGYIVETLPYNGQITYGVASNPQDLSHYKVFVIDEPNILFTDAEKTAIITFVQNGGGLCIISDHTISDRNNDGVDSPQILNDLMGNNLVQNNPFGIAFDYNDISQASSNVANLPANFILHGTAGNVTQVKWSGGTTMTLDTTQNSTVTGLVYKSGSSSTGFNNVLCASAIYQNGKIVAIGDSSIPDDGSGDSGDTLYNGYIDDANGNHQRLLMNAIIWLATSNPLGIAIHENNKFNFSIAPNPIQYNEMKLKYTATANTPLQLSIYDVLGRKIKEVHLLNDGSSGNTIDLNGLNQGMYLCELSSHTESSTLRFIIQ